MDKLMTFKIHHDDDFIILSGYSLDEIRAEVWREVKRRGWDERDCFSEQLKY